MEIRFEIFGIEFWINQFIPNIFGKYIDLSHAIYLCLVDCVGFPVARVIQEGKPVMLSGVATKVYKDRSMAVVQNNMVGVSENVGYIPNEIAIKTRDNDQQNHWVKGVHNIFRQTTCFEP